MSKKLVTSLVAVVALTGAIGSVGCHAEMKVGNAEPKAAPPPPPPAPPPPPPPAPAPAPAPKAEIKAVGKAKVVNNEIQIPGKIQFEFGKATLKETPETQEILKTLASVMKENPSISKLRIEGHTDDKGSSELNHTLSNDRADAVQQWLIKNGVDAKRLAVVGFGEEKPLGPNDTEANREKNRRTEFKIWEIDGQLTETAKADTGPKGATPAATPATPATPANKAGTPATPATPAKPVPASATSTKLTK